MLAESRRLEQQIASIEATLNKAPDGKLYSTRNDNRYKWHRVIDGAHSYIPKKNSQLAEQLAGKKYLSYLLQETIQEKKAIDFYLRHYDLSPKKSLQLLANPAYQELLSPYFKPSSQESIQWMNSSYESNPLHPEHLIHPASSGKMVRSKSEALIDMMLYRNKIPFRYECALTLGETTLYPDFTILHPVTGKIYYWEHFGLMDHPAYNGKAFDKLQLYISHNIIPNVQLITTYETKENPLSYKTVEKTIEVYFL